MHLVHSAVNANRTKKEDQDKSANRELCIRFKAYQATCEKYDREIKAIRQHIPGWTPPFHRTNPECTELKVAF